MSYETRLTELKIELPPAPKPVGSYVAAVRVGDLVFTAEQLPLRDGQLVATGKVGAAGMAGAAVDVPMAQAAARQAMINALAAVRAEVGTLDAVVRVVRLNVFVNSAAGFTDQAQVANGASGLLTDIFGDAGRHTRVALGAAELPLDAAVEVDMIVEVK